MDASPTGLGADAFEVHQNADAQLFDVLANDVFDGGYQGQERITSVSNGSEGGRVSISDNGLFLGYSPPADFAGVESFVYYVDNSLSATVTVTVNSPLTPDNYQVLPTGEMNVLDVMSNDPFWAGYEGPGKITGLSTTALGSELTIAEDGQSLLYTPASHAYGKDSFVYIVDGLYPAQVTVDVVSPLADDNFPGLVEQSENNVLDVLDNDPFWDGSYSGERIITHVGQLQGGGELTIAEDGKTVLYTPAADFYGIDRFIYVVDNMYEATVRLKVHHPVRDDSFEVDIDAVNFSQTLTDNDRFYYDDENGVRIYRDVVENITSVSETTAGGIVTIREDGQGVYYSPPADFEGTDTFEYVADGKYQTTVTVHVTPPVRNDSIDVYEDTLDNVLDVLHNDFRGNSYTGPGIITSVSDPSMGGIVAIAADGRSLIYTPASGVRGNDTFTYTVDSKYEATVNIYTNALAINDLYRFYPDPAQSERVLHVLGNDHFNCGYYPGSGIITAVGETSYGSTVTISDDGKSLRFIPATGEVLGNLESFTYTVDGMYEATVRVRWYDCLEYDRFVVDQNSVDVVLAPLENDFQQWNDGWRDHEPYQGPSLISSASAESGTVSISADGKTLLYTSVADFVDRDIVTYTVDGLMTESSEVQVIRRVRDDQYYVETDSSENVLPVLVNDLFGVDYIGAGLITAVSATQSGGTVTISEDGKSLNYTPPESSVVFTGEDRFVYTVDGQLKAEVVINVGMSADEIFSQFDSMDEFKAWLIADALARYDAQEWTPDAFYLDNLSDASLTFVSELTTAGPSYSETNVQVAGVDEGDLIENDGKYLYVLADGQLVITRAWPARIMKVLSSTSIQGEAIAQYLNGNRLTVISRIRNDWIQPILPVPITTDSWSPRPGILEPWIPEPWIPGPSYSNKTIVTVFDVSNRKRPKIIERTELDGDYVESRRIDDTVFVVMRENHINLRLPGPKRLGVPGLEAPTGNVYGTTIIDGYMPILPQPSTGVYETREEYLARLEAEIDTLIDDMLPHASSYDKHGTLVKNQLLVSPEDLFRPSDISSGALVSVVSLDMGDNVPGIVASTGVLTSGADVIYGTMDNLYLIDDTRTAEDGAATKVMQFDWNAATGSVELAAIGQVAGRMLDQFSIDEYDGHLRIATTIENSHGGNWSDRSANVLFVLRSDHGIMEAVGSIQNLAIDETIRSVRFLGDRAFVTTFQDIDPLFVLDLSDPANPISCGHVTMPGYNSYMQVIDANHILSVGKNTPIGQRGPTQITLFDVSDMAHPQIVETYTLEQFSTSEAETDHHAFGWFAKHQTLALPMARSYYERVDSDGDGYKESRVQVRKDALLVFKIDVTASSLCGDGIEMLGQIENESAVMRSAYIGNVLYSITDKSIQAVHISNPSISLGRVEFESFTDTSSQDMPGNGEPWESLIHWALPPMFIGPALPPTFIGPVLPPSFIKPIILPTTQRSMPPSFIGPVLPPVFGQTQCLPLTLSTMNRVDQQQMLMREAVDVAMREPVGTAGETSEDWLSEIAWFTAQEKVNANKQADDAILARENLADLVLATL